MKPTATDPGGERFRCQVCGRLVAVLISLLGDGFCPACGSHLWARPPADRTVAAVARRIDDLAGQLRRDRFSRQWIVDLCGTACTDEDFAEIVKLDKIEELLLNDTAVTDASLPRLARQTNLEVLDLDGTSITDAGLIELGGLSRLELLSLAGTRVTDFGLAYLEPLEAVWCLDLDDADLDGSGLRRLVRWRDLEWLSLRSTDIGDTALPHLLAFRGLKWLDVQKTRITLNGYLTLKRELSGCRIAWSRRRAS